LSYCRRAKDRCIAVRRALLGITETLVAEFPKSDQESRSNSTETTMHGPRRRLARQLPPVDEKNSQVENADRFGSNYARDRIAARNTSWATP
jgi:hypothetical protein